MRWVYIVWYWSQGSWPGTPSVAFCEAFSTRAKAEEYIKRRRDKKEFFIEEVEYNS